MRVHTDHRMKVCFSRPRDPLNIFHPAFIQSGEAVIRQTYPQMLGVVPTWQHGSSATFTSVMFLRGQNAHQRCSLTACSNCGHALKLYKYNKHDIVIHEIILYYKAVVGEVLSITI